MADKPSGDGGKKVPIRLELQDSLPPLADRLSAVRIQQRLRDRLTAALKRFPRLPAWVGSATSTMPMIDYAVACGFGLTFLVAVELAKQPWLLPAVLWSFLAVLVACSGHWLRDFYRATKPSYVTPSVAITVVLVVICVLVGSYGPIQRIRPMLQVAGAGPSPSSAPTKAPRPKPIIRASAAVTAKVVVTPTPLIIREKAPPPHIGPTVAAPRQRYGQLPKPSVIHPPALLEVTPSGRHLTADQEGILRDQLASLRGHDIQVYANMGDSESQRFARHFYTLFQGIGINEGSGIGQYMNSVLPPPLTVECFTPLPADQNAVELQDAMVLRGALIAANLLSDSSKIQVYAKNMFGKTHLTVLFVGAQTAAQ
jgi:hypothetical protein